MTVYKFAPRSSDTITDVHQAMAKMFQILTRGQITDKEVDQLPERLQDLFVPDDDFIEGSPE
jgi:hypothetical protein